MHWTLTLTCSECGARITYADERPAWREDAADPALVAAAEAWVAAHPRGYLTDGLRCPPYVEFARFTARYVVQIPAPQVYAICPACDGRAYRESGLTAPPEGDDATAERESVAASGRPAGPDGSLQKTTRSRPGSHATPAAKAAPNTLWDCP